MSLQRKAGLKLLSILFSLRVFVCSEDTKSGIKMLLGASQFSFHWEFLFDGGVVRFVFRATSERSLNSLFIESFCLTRYTFTPCINGKKALNSLFIESFCLWMSWFIVEDTLSVTLNSLFIESFCLHQHRRLYKQPWKKELSILFSLRVFVWHRQQATLTT